MANTIDIVEFNHAMFSLRRALGIRPRVRTVPPLLIGFARLMEHLR